jgi:hypothetical protein
MTNLEAIQVLNEKTINDIITNSDKVNRLVHGLDWNYWEAAKYYQFQLSKGIRGLFIWDQSPQGHDYWELVNELLITLHSVN